MTEVRSAQYISAGEISLSRDPSEGLQGLQDMLKINLSLKNSIPKNSQVNFISDIRIYIHKKNTVFNNK